jgi:hypothetical protein
VLSTECLRAASPSGRVGHAKKGTSSEGAAASSELESTEEGRPGLPVGGGESGGSGMGMNRLTFSVAEVERYLERDVNL